MSVRRCRPQEFDGAFAVWLAANEARGRFIIDATGKIAKVSPKTHDDVVLKALAELSG